MPISYFAWYYSYTIMVLLSIMLNISEGWLRKLDIDHNCKCEISIQNYPYIISDNIAIQKADLQASLAGLNTGGTTI